MRRLRISMSRVAKLRLDLLKNPEMLPIPLDAERIQPFGYRFEQGMLCITFQGRDVAYVPENMNADKKSFDIRVRAGESSVIDSALRNVFSALTEQLNRSGSVLAAESRERRNQQMVEVAEEDERAEASLKAFVESIAPFFQRKDTSPVASEVSQEDIRFAMRFKSDTDIVRIKPDPSHQNDASTFFVSFTNFEYPELILRAEWNAGGCHRMHVHRGRYESPLKLALLEALTTTYGGQEVNVSEIVSEIKRMAARNRALLSPESMMNAIRALPESEYDIMAAAMKPPKGLPQQTTHRVPAAEGFEIKISASRITFVKEGCEVKIFDFSPYTPLSPVKETAKSCFRSHTGGPDDTLSHELAERMTDADYQKIGGAWLRAWQEHGADLNFSAYQKTDEKSLEHQAEIMDMGYRI